MSHQFKKQFGQNFLRHSKYAERLVDSLSIVEGEQVVEIGPGDGKVTQALLSRGAQVFAVEVDYDLVVTLVKKFGSNQNFHLIHADILPLDLEAAIATEGGDLLQGYKVTGSLPYNISKMIIQKFLEAKVPPKVMSVIVQEEVAQDYSSTPPKASFLSVWASLYADVKKLVSISNTQFFPVPKVNGAILRFLPHGKLSFEEREMLRGFSRRAFGAPRKTLWNNLRSHYPIDVLTATWEAMNFTSTTRPSTLTLDDWRKLAALLEK